MRVRILLGKLVTDFRDGAVVLNDGQTISTQALIWVSGVTAVRFEGIPKEKQAAAGVFWWMRTTAWWAAKISLS